MRRMEWEGGVFEDEIFCGPAGAGLFFSAINVSNVLSEILQQSETPIKVLGGGGVGEETLLQKGPSPTKYFKVNLVKRVPPPQSISILL